MSIFFHLFSNRNLWQRSDERIYEVIDMDRNSCGAQGGTVVYVNRDNRWLPEVRFYVGSFGIFLRKYNLDFFEKSFFVVGTKSGTNSYSSSIFLIASFGLITFFNREGFLLFTIIESLKSDCGKLFNRLNFDVNKNTFL